MRKTQEVPLSQILTRLESGGRPKGGATSSSGDVPSVGGEHITDEGIFKFKKMKLIPKAFFDSMKQGKVGIGDILIVKDGATTGRSALVRGDFPFENAAVNEHVFCLKINSKVAYAPYVYHFLRSKEGKRRVMLDFRGATVGGISREFIEKTRLPLPTLLEQRKLADIMDRADSIRWMRQKSIEKINTLTQSIFLEMFGDPILNPKKLPALPLTEACKLYSGGTPSKANSKFWEGTLPWFSPKDLKKNDLFDSIDHINEIVPSVTSIRKLPENTVVIVVRGMILAHTFPVCVLRVPATINQDMKALLPNNDMNFQFLAACVRIQSKLALSQASESAHGTKRLDVEGLRKITVLIPSIGEQNIFAQRVLAVEQQTNKLMQSYASINEIIDALKIQSFKYESVE